MAIPGSDKEGHATILVFSGRKNPGWTILPANMNELLHTWQSAVTISHYSPIPNVPGYNGLLLQQGNKQWHVVNGLIYYKLNDELMLVKEDTGNNFEKHLLAAAPVEITDLLKQVKSSQ